MEFLEYIVKQMVSYPDQVKIDRSVDEMGVLLKLEVASSDMGKIIGRAGATSKALRTILMTWGMARGQRLHLKIVDPPGVEYVKRPAEDVENIIDDIN